MEVIQYCWRTLLTILISLVLFKTTGCLLVIKHNGWAKLSLLIGCFLIGMMIIFIGDWVNILPTITVFMGTIWLTCSESKLKKMTLGLMIASTVLAANALWDNFFDTIWHYPLRLLFVSMLYIGTKKFAPTKGYELGANLWRLLLLLTLTPIGIVLSVIVLTDGNYDGLPSSEMYLVLLLIAVCLFIGLLWTVTVL